MGTNRKIAIVVGARPQFIKIALLTRILKEWSDVILIHTGQHYDYEMSDSFFEQINIDKPRYNLEIGSGNHGEQTGKMLAGLEKIFLAEIPDLVIVVGDTNSTLAGALAASKLHIKIAHIEAGMRNFDRKKPEEINRIVTDHISDYFFPPTPNAKKNLEREGLTNNLFVVGDISNDVFLKNIEKAEKESTILKDNNLQKGTYRVLTIHKSKNTDSKKNLEAILLVINQVKERIVFPIHPRTKKTIEKYGLESLILSEYITIVKPLTYLDMIKLMKNSKMIITDSGGVQKEAYALKLPCLTLRKTEWIETVEEGWNKEIDIFDSDLFLDLIHNFQPNQKQSNFLGTGNTYQKINDILCQKIM